LAVVSLRSKLTREEIHKAREINTRDVCKECPSEILMFERGMGMDYTGVIIAMRKDYSSYTKLRDRIKGYDFIDQLRTNSFIIDLQDEIH